ncbi:hypothetical protein ACFL59_14060, partial [Planctomycetota bacterium]
MSDRDELGGRWLAERFEALTGRPLRGHPKVHRDTSGYMSIERDEFIDLDGRLYLIRASAREGRFGIDDQPKFWVKHALEVESGRRQVLKLVFHEEFNVRIGPISFRCTRSEDKEGRVLEAVRGDPCFMQGHSAPDLHGNLVRVLDFIRGPTLLQHVGSLEMPHEQYFHQELPPILASLLESFRALARLHTTGLCHGDIRNDHIFIDRDTGRYRWIDFDLTQAYSDFDVWSLGNVLQFVVGKAFVSFRSLANASPEVLVGLSADDASLFFPHRVMNLVRVFPYVPEKLNAILLRFSAGAEDPDSVDSSARSGEGEGDRL